MGAAKAKNVATVYQAPREAVHAAGVRLVDLREVRPVFGTHPVEYVVYEGTEAALAGAGLVPVAMFAIVGKSGKKSARLTHPDGRIERVRLSQRSGDLWRVRKCDPLA